MTSRRRFIGAAGVAGTAGVLAAARPWRLLDGAGASASARPSPDGSGVLVLVTLYGGNDGLNTVVPASDPAYQAGRPTLGYKPDEVLALADGLGLNPKLPSLAKMWAAGQLAVVRGVGYPGPSLSHFDSMDIWQTANPTSGTGPGWLGKWLDGTSGDPLRAVSVGATLPIVMRGERSAACALTSTTITLPGSAQSQMALSSLVAPGVDRRGMAAVVASSGRELLAARTELDGLRSHPVGPAPSPDAQGPEPSLTDQLEIVAALIKAGAPGRVYQVSLSSFDTHADEKTAHEAKLAELDAGVAALFAGLEGAPQAEKVVLMTYSEFGRRVAQNASGGTDHGTAAPLFVVGEGVKGGFYGEEPSLTALDPDGNLISTVDFRQVYATVLERVVGTDPTKVLGGAFPTLGFV